MRISSCAVGGAEGGDGSGDGESGSAGEASHGRSSSGARREVAHIYHEQTRRERHGRVPVVCISLKFDPGRTRRVVRGRYWTNVQ